MLQNIYKHNIGIVSVFRI